MSIARMMQQAAAGNAKDTAWDLSYAYYDPSFAWDISSSSYIGRQFSVAGQETNPQGIFFKPDGTKMYVIGPTGDAVNEYNLSTAWNVSTASFLQAFSVSAEETSPSDLFFKPDGTKMYVVGTSGDDVNEYDLSTAWDVSTASYVQNFSVASQTTFPIGLFFKPDGSKMYVTGNGLIIEYNLSTAWDVSTASFLQSKSLTAQDTALEAVSFKPDGTKMYVLGSVGDDVNEYDLSTAWDVSTASYVQNFSVASFETAPKGLFFKPDGTAMYIVGSGQDTVYHYKLGGFLVKAQEGTPTGFFFKPDGTKLYVTGYAGDDVNEYALSTAWDTSTAVYVQNFSVAAQETIPTDVFFSTDGTKMYVLGDTGNDVNEYSLSTAWNISTASYVRVFSVNAQEPSPQGIFFKPDGTKMYVIGNGSRSVHEYNLSTAWNISTASYLQSFSVIAQDTAPLDLFFKPDGTKMYVLGNIGDDVNEYDLSTAWDVSTASYVQNFSVAEQGTQVEGLFFGDDGAKMFVIERGGATIDTYTLGPQP